jgi:tetratricopeptide (TPR) repeat protein
MMTRFSAFVFSLALLLAAAPAVPARADAGRNDYANGKFIALLDAGMKHFYAKEFQKAEDDFNAAAAIVPDNTLAISFADAAASQTGQLNVLVNLAEDAASANPKNYVNRIRLGFIYLMQSQSDRPARVQDARDEFTAALAIDPKDAAAHVGMGILRFNERSANRAKIEFLSALQADPNDVLAREYLASIYQVDLQDSQRALTYAVGIPNAVPNYADSWFHLGSILFDLKQYDAALKDIDKGIELDTGHVGEAGQQGYTLGARVLIDMHRYDDAKKMLQASIDANVNVIYARALIAKINRDLAAAKDKNS